MSKSDKRELDICAAIKLQIDRCIGSSTTDRARWRESRKIFRSGSPLDKKEEWQSQFSVNDYNVSIRRSAAAIVQMIVQNDKWFELEPAATENLQAARLATAFQKLINYYLEKAKFKEHAEANIISSFVGMANMYVGWKKYLKQNPQFMIEQTEKLMQKEGRRINSKVANPQVEPSFSQSELENSLSEALDDFVKEATGEDVVEASSTPEVIQWGGLEFIDIIDERFYWEPGVQYMFDSRWKAFEIDVPLYELTLIAEELGIPENKIKKIADTGKSQFNSFFSNVRTASKILNRRTSSPSSSVANSDLIKVTYYVGPLIEAGRVTEKHYYAIIANDSVILKDGKYPFWEPDGEKTSIVSASINKLPYEPIPAGIGENAVAIQKTLDSNYMMACDSFRLALMGLSAVDVSKLEDPSQLDEGNYPGKIYHVKGEDVRKVFQRTDIASPISNQVHPIQNELAGALEKYTGVNELQMGGNNPYSRTSATETEAKLQSGQNHFSSVAYQLECSFFIPVIKKSFARILQFGIPDIQNQPEVLALLTNEEQQEILNLSAQDRIAVLNQWYNFKVNGLSAMLTRKEDAMRDNELLQIFGGNPLYMQLIDIPTFLKDVFIHRGVKDPSKYLLSETTPYELITKENELLLNNRMVVPSQNDDHNLHLQMQAPLAQSPYATPELIQHVQMHMQAAQAMQQMAGEDPEKENVQ